MSRPFTALTLFWGIGVFLTAFFFIQPALIGEPRDWWLYVSLVLSVAGFGLAEFCFPQVHTRARRLVPWIARANLVAVTGLAVVNAFWFAGANLLESAALRDVSWPGLTWFVAGILVLCLESLPTVWAARRIYRRKLLGEVESGWLGFSLVAAFVYLLARVNDVDQPLTWLSLKYGTSFLVLPVSLWLCSHVFFPSASAIPSREPKPWVSIAISVLFFIWILFWSRLPSVYATAITMLHWSFFMGPVQAVKQGGILLYETPSQYGFLNILSAAALPWDTVRSFHYLIAFLLIVQACGVYALVRTCAFLRGAKWFAPFVAFTTVYLFVGDRTTATGAFAFPSASVGRFFWVWSLALLLVRPQSQRLSRTRATLTAVAFAAGVLWSAESAFACVGAFLACTFAEAMVLMRSQDRRSSWLWRRVMLPILALTLAVQMVEVCYATKWGVRPEWRALFEYARLYQGGLAAFPIPWNTVFPGLLVVWLSLSAFLFSHVSRARTLSAASLFGLWGAMSASLPYFISRSHPENVCNLIALWFAFIVVSAKRAWREDAEWFPVLRVLLFVLCTIVFLMSFGKVTPFFSRIQELTTAPWSQDAHYGLEHGFRRNLDQASLAAGMSVFDPSVPLLDLTEALPSVPLRGLFYKTWLPTFPTVHFLVLPAERQRVYLERMLSRRLPERGQLYRSETQPHMDERVIDEVLGKYFRRVRCKPGHLPGFVLELYEQKGERDAK